MEEKNPCIAMVPSPGFSNLIPLFELAKRLAVHLPQFHFTFLIPTLGPPSPTTLSFLQSLPPHIDFTILPQINMEDLPHKAHEHPAVQIHQTVILSLPSLRQALSSISSRTHLVAMVVNMFSVDALEIAKQFNLKTYLHFASTATSLSFCLHLPRFDEDHEMVSSGFRELSQPLKLPGCGVAFHGNDLLDTVQERSSKAYETFLQMSKQFHHTDGIMVNTFFDLERGPITALQDPNHTYPPVYPVGPIIQSGSSNINGSASECLRWLDNQPPSSVLYVSFGSGGTLSRDQLHELALGLEMSGHKFLWVVRAPSESASSAYLSAQKEDPLDHLPDGFINRTKGQALVVPSWAPQIEVLRHVAVGGFLTHCGWNSTLESMVYGKPMIAWPLFAEQRMNAVLLTEEFKVAVRPKVDENNNNNNGIVGREEVGRVVKSVMEEDEGGEMRRRIGVLKDAATKAISEDGSSTRTLSDLALKWKKLSDMPKNI